MSGKLLGKVLLQMVLHLRFLISEDEHQDETNVLTNGGGAGSNKEPL